MTYTSSQAQAGRGASLSIGATPVLIAEIASIQLNRGEWQTVTVTNLESGLDDEILQTIRANGSVSFKLNRVSSDAGQAALEAAYQTPGSQPFVLQLPKTASQTVNGDKYTFSALVIKSNLGSIEPKTAIEGDVELKITGPSPLVVGS